MSYKKNTLLIIVIIALVSLIFSHNLYGYLELSLNKLASLTQPNEHLNSQAKTKKTEKGIGLKATTKPSQPSQRSFAQKKKVKVNKCPSTLPDITTHPLKYQQVDGSIGYKSIKKYYEINTNLAKGDDEFLTELTLRLNAAFQHLEKKLGITLKKTVTLNFVFQTSRAGYENYVKKLGLSPEGNQGMYLSYNNLSIVELTDSKQGITIAIHEAIHAFNNAYWGHSLRFFNEGLAQHLSAIDQKGIVPPFDFSWLAHQSYPMQISTLLFSETDWHTNNNHELYQNSKALFNFLMNNDKGREVVLKIMQLEMADHCTTLPKETIEEILFDIFPNHEQEFNYWFRDGLNELIEARRSSFNN